MTILLSDGHRGLFPWEVSGQFMKLTTHLHPMPRSRMRGAIPPFLDTPSWRGAELKHRYSFNLTFS